MPKRMVKTGTSTDAVSKKGVPADVREALNMLYSMRHELPDTMMEPIRDLVENYRDDIHEWDKTGRVPDWNYFRSAINEICDEDGMPHLCETPKSSRTVRVKAHAKPAKKCLVRRKTTPMKTSRRGSEQWVVTTKGHPDLYKTCKSEQEARDYIRLGNFVAPKYRDYFRERLTVMPISHFAEWVKGVRNIDPTR